MNIDWRIFFSTFAIVFLAELGDKTQLATLSMACSSNSRWVVFVAAALALVTITLISVVAADFIHRLAPAHVIKRVAGVLFVLMGMFIILGK